MVRLHWLTALERVLKRPEEPEPNPFSSPSTHSKLKDIVDITDSFQSLSEPLTVVYVSMAINGRSESDLLVKEPLYNALKDLLSTNYERDTGDHNPELFWFMEGIWAHQEALRKAFDGAQMAEAPSMDKPTPNTLLN